MCQMTAAGYEGQGSPDRVDAMVWALTELFPKGQTKRTPKSLYGDVSNAAGIGFAG